MKKFISFLLTSLIAMTSWAQEVEMADNFRSEGKIYVVVVVISIVVLGIFAYLFYLDKRLKNLEKENKQ